jgi:hypothetical protein
VQGGLGTLTPLLETREGGRTDHSALWGSTDFNFDRDVPRTHAYLAAPERMRQTVKDQGIDLLLFKPSANDGSVQATRGRAGGSAGLLQARANGPLSQDDHRITTSDRLFG